jgi:predicted nucleic acid-binding protein
MKDLIITDTNVFIDLIKTGALEYFMQLEYHILTTGFVLNEINHPEQKATLERCLTPGRVEIIDFSGEEMLHILRFRTRRNLKRLTDKSVLFLAVQRQCPLLSGDGDLRKEAQDNGLTVFGSLWVIAQLVEQLICTPQTGVLLLKRLERCNPRLPKKKMEELIERLEGKTVGFEQG